MPHIDQRFHQQRLITATPPEPAPSLPNGCSVVDIFSPTKTEINGLEFLEWGALAVSFRGVKWLLLARTTGELVLVPQTALSDG